KNRQPNVWAASMLPSSDLPARGAAVPVAPRLIFHHSGTSILRFSALARKDCTGFRRWNNSLRYFARFRREGDGLALRSGTGEHKTTLAPKGSLPRGFLRRLSRGVEIRR